MITNDRTMIDALKRLFIIGAAFVSKGSAVNRQ